MRGQIETVITCPKCDDAFTIKYSKYSPQKPVTCVSCGSELPLPVEEEAETPSGLSVTGSEVASAELRKSIEAETADGWFMRNRYIVSGAVCFVLALVFMTISLTTLEAYLPLLALALVFGVIAVVNRTPVQGLALILVTIIGGALFNGWLFELRCGEDLRDFGRKMERTSRDLEREASKLEELLSR